MPLVKALPERVMRAQEALATEPWPHLAHSFLKSKYPWGTESSVLASYHIGLEPNSWGRPAILFPTRALTGEWHYSRRSIQDGPKYEHDTGIRAPLFMELPPQEEVVWLTEGHPDTITARWLGFRAMGLMGTASWKLHLETLSKFREVNVVMDADAAGWKAACSLYRELCNVRLVFIHPMKEDFFPGTEWLGYGDEGSATRYTELKMDLTDIAKLDGRSWARWLVNDRRGGAFGPGHRSFCRSSGESCTRGGPRVWRQGDAQARLSAA